MSRQRRPSIGRGTSPQRHAERGLAGYEWRASARQVDRKSTRLNSSHLVISYAVFCLKKSLGEDGFVVSCPMLPGHQFRTFPVLVGGRLVVGALDFFFFFDVPHPKSPLSPQAPLQN